jgi:hypothetical protein
VKGMISSSGKIASSRNRFRSSAPSRPRLASMVAATDRSRPAGLSSPSVLDKLIFGWMDAGGCRLTCGGYLWVARLFRYWAYDLK